MNVSVRIKCGKYHVSEQSIYNSMLFVYLCLPLIKLLVQWIVSFAGLSDFSTVIVIFFLLLPYFIICIKKRRLMVQEFWIIYLVIAAFFGITILIHPEYEYWYTRSDYGVWSYVLRPDNGLFIYLFIRLINDPGKIKRIIRLSAWPMYLYHFRSVAQALARGYWIDTSNHGYAVRMSYNLSLGYSVLLFALVFLYAALEEKKIYDWIGAFTGIAIILVAGSRGPFLDIGIFLIIYVMLKVSRSRKKVILLLCLTGGIILFWVIYPYLMSFASELLSGFGVSSRFINKLIAGTITEDSGRYDIWNAAIEMIAANPLGYGAMGSRHVIAQFAYVAHPHQIFLEILIDFGVILGTGMIIWLGYQSVKLFTMKEQDEWKALFLVFFARACQLLISLTFWHSIGLWGAIAVGVCMCRARREEIEDGGE